MDRASRIGLVAVGYCSVLILMLFSKQHQMKTVFTFGRADTDLDRMGITVQYSTES